MGKASQKLLSLWTDRVNTSKKWKEQVVEQNRWETYIQEYEGQYDVVLGNQYVPPINEVYAYIEASKSNLFQNNPYIAVNAKKSSTIEGAVIWEALLNHDWKDLHCKEDVELEITDTILVGHGWNKVGNNVKTSGSGDQLRLESERLYSNRVSWRDMFFNIGCKRPMVDSLWKAQRIYRPTDDLKKEYGSVASKLSGSPFPELSEKIRKDMLYKDDVNFSAIYEVWDARERKVYLMADEHTDDFLEDPRPWPDYLEKDPYDMLSFVEIPDKPYPMSDIAPWNAQILEKIKVFTMILNHVKKGNRQLIMRKGVLKDQEKDKYEKGLDGSILEAAVAANADIQTAFKFLDYGQMPADYYMMLDRLDQVKRSVNGQPEFEQGAGTKTGSRTLGELNLIKGGSAARTQRKQDRIESHCANIAKQLMANRKANLNVEMVVKVTGNEPAKIIQAFQSQGKYDPVSRTIRFSPDDIKGDYDVSIKAGSTLPLDKEGREAILDNVLNMAIPLASAPTLPPFIAEIIKERLRDYGIKGLEVAFSQQQQAIVQKDEGNQASQAMEVAKTESETTKRQAQAQQIRADTIIKTAQALGKASGDIPNEVSLTK